MGQEKKSGNLQEVKNHGFLVDVEGNRHQLASRMLGKTVFFDEADKVAVRQESFLRIAENRSA